MLSDLLEIFDQQSSFLFAQKGTDFIRFLYRFVDFARSHPEISPIVNDLLAEESKSLDEFLRSRALLADELTRLRDAIVAQIPSQMEDTLGRPVDIDGLARRADEVLSRLQETPRAQGASPDGDLSTHAFRLLRDLFGWADRPPGRGELDWVASTIQQTETASLHAFRSRMLAAATNGGAAYARITATLSALKPAPEAIEDEVDAAVWQASVHEGITAAMYKRLYSPAVGWGAWPSHAGAVTSDLELAQRGEAELRRDANVLCMEIRSRIGGRRSLLAAMSRFKQRAEWYDADRLRDIYRSNTRRGEDLLTEQLALFLFDQGMRPLLRPLMGRLQPDLVNTQGWQLYVESKISSSDKSKKYLLTGIYQMWDTLSRLRVTGFDITEAFFVCFRINGPGLAFPRRLHSGGVTIHPLVVDIAPSNVSGSKQKLQPWSFSDEEMLPV